MIEVIATVIAQAVADISPALLIGALAGIWTIVTDGPALVLAILGLLILFGVLQRCLSPGIQPATARLNPDPADAKERQKQEYYKAAEKSQKRPTGERVQVICVRCRWQSSTVPTRATERTKSLNRFAKLIKHYLVADEKYYIVLIC